MNLNQETESLDNAPYSNNKAFKRLKQNTILMATATVMAAISTLAEGGFFGLLCVIFYSLAAGIFIMSLIVCVFSAWDGISEWNKKETNQKETGPIDRSSLTAFLGLAFSSWLFSIVPVAVLAENQNSSVLIMGFFSALYFVSLLVVAFKSANRSKTS
jgi:hypothetical protein